jgi:hypothetical protein
MNFDSASLHTEEREIGLHILQGHYNRSYHDPWIGYLTECDYHSNTGLMPSQSACTIGMARS